MDENITYLLVSNRLFCVENRYTTTFKFNNSWELSDIGVHELERCDDFEILTEDEAMWLSGGQKPDEKIEELYSLLDEPKAER